MNPERLKKVEEIYHEVLEVSPNERQSFLQIFCGNDIELRREVESLLSFEQTDAGLIDSSPSSIAAEMFADKPSIIGTQINQYKILSLLGEGGMGTVYLAEDTTLERKVAIKLLSNDFSFDANRRNRFFQEAKSASALNHPNILTVHEIGEVAGTHYLVTEFINGKTLNPYLHEQSATLQNILDIATQIASALSAAHEAGIIHRDIKPDNIMVRNDGIVKILDFGIAKLTDTGISTNVDTEAKTRAKTMTVAGTIIGTPKYMSPEQARGQKVDLRTDIFSFGVVLYEMLTGCLPFSGATNIDVIGSILKDEPKSLREHQPEISINLENIVKKALCKDRDGRYQRIKDIFADLNDAKKTIETDTKFAHQTVAIKADTKINTTAGIVSERRFSLMHALIFLPISGALFGLVWWFMPTPNGGTLIDSPLKSTEIISWASKPGEVYSEGSFSPDGKMIAFTSTKVGTKNIWIKQTNSGEAIQITKDEFRNGNPIWSPNGEEIAFYSVKESKAGFWRIPVLGGSPQLIYNVDDDSSRLRLWSKNNLIYYESNNELFSIDISSGQKKQVTNLVSKGITGTSLNISLDEKQIAYVTIEGELKNLWISDIKGENPKKMFDPATQIKNIVWHPDNKRLFYSSLTNGIFQIFVADASGIKPRQLSNSEQDSLALDISADGKKILYGSAKEESDIWGVSIADSKEFTVVSDIDSELWADVSPDGKTLAYQSIKNLSQGNKLFSGNIFTKTLGTNESPAETVKIGGLPKWSPDGKTIAYVKSVADKRQIETVKTLSGEKKQITVAGIMTVSYSMLPYNLTQTNDFSWSPDSSKIAYISAKSGQRNIWLVNVDGSNDVKITENNDENVSLYCPIWSPDGKKIAFSSKINNSDETLTFTIQQIETETKKNDLLLTQNSFIRLIDWLQDGNELMFMSGGNSDFALPMAVSLKTIEADTGKITRTIELKDTYPYNIHLSPDKKHIAFASHREEKDNIWTMSLINKQTKKITNNNDSRLYFSSLTWSPDSGSIYFGKQLRYSLLSMLTNFN
jgi:eukaryotic-like serine/threonine-protein kinase